MAKNENVIILKQEPIITYDLIEKIGIDVAERISSLSLDAIEPSEDNLKLLKTTRTKLKKEFDVFENQRKMVKELVMKPYNDFEEKYKKHISSLFKDADIELKYIVCKVEDEILKRKIDVIREYFGEVNKYDFVTFEDMELKIIKSISDKRIKEQIDKYLSEVGDNLKTIETLENKDRILVKYQMYKDINRAISETQIETKREAEIKARNEAETQKDKQKVQHQEEKIAHKKVETEEPKKFRVKFEVIGTKEEITELKKYMNEKGLRYE